MFILLSCSNNVDMNIINSPFSAKKNHDISLPIIYMSEDDFNFGEVLQGELVTYDFKIKNTGNSNLLIADARGSCGCTVPKCPTTPIMPGEKGTMKVRYDTKRTGRISKTVTVKSNANNGTITLKVVGHINANQAPEAMPANTGGPVMGQ